MVLDKKYVCLLFYSVAGTELPRDKNSKNKHFLKLNLIFGSHWTLLNKASSTVI